ncbi:hypothetical protein [Paraburkholderia sp. BCC1885]|uniref:hypothetical protein n=1 Tax=Paraburkholderia sp. BCC1885 TaxID=2562669 RepID=UPI0011826D69|nr:hypothetical protein [Paraburkholderia sp. BCC1885]
MNKITIGMIAAALIAAAPLVSSAAGSLPAPFEGSSVLQAEGVVKGIDPAKHMVTVVDPQGGQASFTVTDPGNLAQIRQGSKVQVRVMRSAMVSPTRSAASAHPSPQTRSAEVVALDRASGVLELKGSDGAVFHIQGRDAAKVVNMKPGMHVEVAYAPQVSISVAPAAQ